jgi:hypothetical protein
MTSVTRYLRLMRFGLAPTAAADVAVLYFLTHSDPWSGAMVGVMPEIRWGELGRLMLASVGLYCFGMVQNDLVDRPRDALARRDRPLAIGEVAPPTAALLAAACAAVAMASAYSLGLYPFLAAAATFALINTYHLVAKTLGGLGLLNLGLIRLANAMMFVADSQLTWPPFVLFAHVTLLSVAAYRLEGKPPPLGTRDAIVLGVGCAIVAAATAAGRFLPPLRVGSDADLAALPPFGPPPWLSTAASMTAFAAFLAYIGYINGREDLPGPARGGRLIKNGLLFLFVLDASFLAFDRWVGAAVVLSGLPVCRALMTGLRRPSVFRDDGPADGGGPGG